jgi:hypothetical protein
VASSGSAHDLILMDMDQLSPVRGGIQAGVS